MVVINFLIAVTALVVAILAYQKAEGSKDMKEQLTSLRERTADTLSKMEKAIRKEEKEGEDKEESGPAK
jgi:hypothetical protein